MASEHGLDGLTIGRLAFELIALLEAANALSVLHRTDARYRRAEAGVRSRLTAADALVS